MKTAGLGAPGIDEMKWLRPVRPGDVLSVRIHADSKRVLASRPDVGMAAAVYSVINQARRDGRDVDLQSDDPRAQPGTEVRSTRRPREPRP